jgi:hypothetical protein
VGTKSGGERLLKHIASHIYIGDKIISALINAGESANCMCGGRLMHFLVAAYFVSRPRVPMGRRYLKGRVVVHTAPGRHWRTWYSSCPKSCKPNLETLQLA